MKKQPFKLSYIIGILLCIMSANATDYTIDPAHTSIQFKIKHLGISTVTGNFSTFSGTFKYDSKKDELSEVNFTVDASTISTLNKKRDEHLRSADFFDVKKFPNITFTSKSIKGNKKVGYMVKGLFNMHGIKKELTLDAKLNGMATSPWGQHVISFEGSSKLNRKDFGLNWNKALEAGGFLVGEEVKIVLSIEAQETKKETIKETKK